MHEFRVTDIQMKQHTLKKYRRNKSHSIHTSEDYDGLSKFNEEYLLTKPSRHKRRDVDDELLSSHVPSRIANENTTQCDDKVTVLVGQKSTHAPEQI